MFNYKDYLNDIENTVFNIERSIWKTPINMKKSLELTEMLHAFNNKLEEVISEEIDATPH